MIDSPFYTFMPCVNSPDKYCTFKKKRLCRNVQCQAERSTGIHPRHSRFPQNSIIPQTGTTSLSQNAGAVRGDRHCPHRLLLVLHISCHIKGITMEKPRLFIIFASESMIHLPFCRAQFFKKLSYSYIRDIFIPGPTIDTIIMAREISRIGKRTLVSS